MKLHELKPQEGSHKRRKRVGQGIAAGQGRTAGRGQKGQNSRSGGGTRLYHQGGNLPFFRRLPFVRGQGFTPIHQTEYNEVNLDQLKGLKGEITPEKLAKANMLRDPEKPVVILGRGDVKTALTVRIHRISKIAQEKIQAAGGTVEIIELNG
jgi:large subunit ribosomal protein L15